MGITEFEKQYFRKCEAFESREAFKFNFSQERCKKEFGKDYTKNGGLVVCIKNKCPHDNWLKLFKAEGKSIGHVCKAHGKIPYESTHTIRVYPNNPPTDSSQ